MLGDNAKCGDSRLWQEGSATELHAETRRILTLKEEQKPYAGGQAWVGIRFKG
jgi:hypothetical protein